MNPQRATELLNELYPSLSSKAGDGLVIQYDKVDADDDAIGHVDFSDRSKHEDDDEDED